MSISEDRLSHLAHLVCDGIYNDDLVDYSDEDSAMRAAKRAVSIFAKEEVDLDKDVRAKVASLKRNVIEGSPEWDVMYSKYYQEEMKRRGEK